MRWLSERLAHVGSLSAAALVKPQADSRRRITRFQYCVGGFDIHCRQVTFDCLDTVAGQARRGRIDPACRQTLREWLARFAGRDDVTFAVEGCTGWRFVVEELQRAGVTALLAG